MIDQDRRSGRNYRKPANPNELKETIERYKKRTERFGNDEEEVERR